MSNVVIVRNYLEKFFSGKVHHSEVRSLLTDDFSFHGPLMSAASSSTRLILPASIIMRQIQ
jgi:hypothetical protein